MPDPRDFLPQPPQKGPPLPKILGRIWAPKAEAHEKLVQELNALQDQRWDLDRALSATFDEINQIRIAFEKKNPGTKFIGSPEWEQAMNRRHQMAHSLVEVEDKIKAVGEKLDAFTSPEERKLESKLDALDDKMSDVEELISEAEDAGKDTTLLKEKMATLTKQHKAIADQLEAKVSHARP